MTANGVSQRIFDALRDSFEKKTPVDQLVHNKLLEFFRLYLIVGGMPAVVQKYLDTNNIADVVNEQKSIIRLYKKDIAKYDPHNGNVEQRGKITYLPVYMLMFVKNASIDEKMIYRIDPDLLKD